MKIKKPNIFIINILVILLILFFYNLFIYIRYTQLEFRKNNRFDFIKNTYFHTIKPKFYFSDIDKFYEGRTRKPDGLEFTKNGKLPIIIFGCSFAYGDGLEQNQTFSYKLAHMLKRPVYNRAIPAGGPQYMYYQVTQDAFYEQVPESDTVIYVLIDDHIRRMISRFFNITTKYMYIRYVMKDNKLVMDNYNNIFYNFLDSLYIYRYFKMQKNADDAYFTYNTKKMTNLFYEHVNETKNELEKHWNRKVNFVVLFYSYRDIPHSKYIKRKLIKNGITVIDTNDLVKENLAAKKYAVSKQDPHPNEAVWDLLTPLIIKELKKQNVI